MHESVQTLWSVIKDFYPNLARVVLLNIFWFVCSLPILTIPAAYGGLAYATRILVYEESEYRWQVFFEGFKKTFFWSWLWFLPNILVFFVLITNILFFQSENQSLSLFIKAGNVVLMAFWFFLQTFTFPFLFEQQKPRMITALRNSFAVLVHAPWLFFITSLFTLTVAIIGVILTVPWIFISVGFCMYISVGMLRKTLEAMELRNTDILKEK